MNCSILGLYEIVESLNIMTAQLPDNVLRLPDVLSLSGPICERQINLNNLREPNRSSQEATKFGQAAWKLYV